MKRFDLNGMALTFAMLDHIEEMIAASGESVEVVNIGVEPDPPPPSALLFRGITDLTEFRDICIKRRIMPSLKKFALNRASLVETAEGKTESGGGE